MAVAVSDSLQSILVVDDEELVRAVLKAQLENIGFACQTAASGRAAIEAIEKTDFSVVLLDITMPVMDGLGVLAEIRGVEPTLPVVMVTAVADMDNVRRALRLGAYDYLLKPVEPEELENAVRRAVEYRLLQLSNREYQRHLEQMVRERTAALQNAVEKIERTYQETILALGSALETRDVETETHALRVARYAEILAVVLEISDKQQLAEVQRGSYLHDVGKIGVPDSILLKPGPLDDEEWAIMRTHPELGKRMVEGIEFLKGAIPIIHCHHERYDGTGYPRGLSGDDIPLGARIFAIADALDAMLSDRPYRKAFAYQTAAREINKGVGRQFDPAAVAAFNQVPPDQMASVRQIK